MDPPYGRSVVRTATTTYNKPRQRRHNIATLSLVTTYFYFIYLLDAIVISFVVPYRPPRNAVPILPSILGIGVNTLLLHASCLGLGTCCCRSKLPTDVPRSRSWALVLLLQFREVRLTPCLQRWYRVRKESACCRTNENRCLSRATSVPSPSLRESSEWSLSLIHI